MSNDSQPDSAGVYPLPPVFLFAAIVASLLLDFVIPLPIGHQLLSFIAGVLVAGVAIKISVHVRQRFLKAGTHVPPNKPTTTILTDGIFARSRNPIYISFLLVLLGLTLLFNSLWFACFIPVMWLYLQFFVIAKEEAYLERKFGEEYTNYKLNVRRWI